MRSKALRGREREMKRSLKARISSSRAHPFLKTGKSRSHYLPNLGDIYSQLGGLRRKPSEAERWLANRKQVASANSERFGLLAGRR